MFKFILFARLITKGGTHQECAPMELHQSQDHCPLNAERVENNAMHKGFFVRAVCVEVE